MATVRFRRTGRGDRPVSYTHLDVYKRQYFDVIFQSFDVHDLFQFYLYQLIVAFYKDAVYLFQMCIRDSVCGVGDVLFVVFS